MYWSFSASVAAVLVVVGADSLRAGEPESAGFVVTPAMRSIAARGDAQAAHEYFYVDFPRSVQALQNETELAEAELALIARRVENYRPFRSFGRYAATYTADLSWQIELLAAEQRLQCLRDNEAALWRERRLAAEALMLRSP